MPDGTPDSALKLAVGAHFKTAAELLSAWTERLTPAERAKVDELEQKGVSLGVAVSAPRGQCSIHVFAVDAAGETRNLAEIGLECAPRLLN